MLGRVTHDRHHDYSDEDLGEADGVPDVFDRADEKLREQCDHGGRDEQDSNGLPARPLLAAFIGMSRERLGRNACGSGARNRACRNR